MDNIPHEGGVVLGTLGDLHQDIVARTAESLCPVFIRPAIKRKACQGLSHPETYLKVLREVSDHHRTSSSKNRKLLRHNSSQAQSAFAYCISSANRNSRARRLPWLIMPRELRDGLANIVPLSGSSSPPGVILSIGVELRQIICHQQHVRLSLIMPSIADVALGTRIITF